MIGLAALQRRFRHLNRDAVHVEAGQGVGADLRQVRAVEQIEHAQVEEERIVGLPGEDAARRAVRLIELVDAAAVPAVVRRRCGADVVVHRLHRPGGEDRAAAVDPRHRVGLDTDSGSGRRAIVIGPVLYRNVFGFVICDVNRNW